MEQGLPAWAARGERRLTDAPDSEDDQTGAPRPGIRLYETVQGAFALGAEDPREGVRLGNSEHGRSTLDLAIFIPDVRRFVEEETYSGLAKARIRFPALGDPIPATEGTFTARATQEGEARVIEYGLHLEWKGGERYLLGQKELRAPSGIDLWLQATTLSVRLHEGRDAESPAIGAGVLNLSPQGLSELLWSMEATNAGSKEESSAIVSYFGRHLMGELYEEWVRRGRPRTDKGGMMTRLRRLMRRG